MYRNLTLAGFLLLLWAGQACAWVATPSLTTEYRFESNSGAAAVGSGGGDDSILKASPRLDLEKKGMNAAFNAGYGFTGNYYLNGRDRDWTAHKGTAGLDMKVSPLTELHAGYDFTYTREPREVTLTGIEAFRTAAVRSHNGHVRGSYTISSRLAGSLSLSGNALEFEDPSAVDSRTYSAGAAGEFRWTERTSITPAYGFTEISYDSAASTGIRTHSLTAGFSTRHSESLTYGISAGMTYSTGLGDHLDWTAAAVVSKSLRRGSVSASYSRSVSNSSGLSDELNINDTVSAVLTRHLSESASMSVRVAYAMNNSEPAGRVDLQSYSADVGISWKPLPWAAVGAGVSHFNQLSDGIAGAEMERNSLYLNLTVHGEHRL